ncbi:glycerophosphodiester phosphodiesterase family protein [Gracilibacillus marinus]|uniref:Glycerophosphodiester phosphodiesterase family protein n=1 Tax=Gracilibacillus marinus TaxID=630535 RepID=A0ABV8VZ31_9BACI
MKRTIAILIIALIFGIIMFTSIPSKEEEALPVSIFNKQESLLSKERVLNIAHRGASGHAPEHTARSYQLAKEMEADYLEIDLHVTKDKHLVAIHDKDLNRVANKKGKVSDYTLAELKMMDVGTWFYTQHPEKEPVSSQLMTLEEIIEMFGQEVNYYIEWKQANGLEVLLLDVLRETGILQNDREGGVIIQSFNDETLKSIAKLEPSVPLIQLYSFKKSAELTKREIKEIKKYAIGIGVNYQSLHHDFVEKILANHLLVHAYTVNNEKEMKELIQMGVTGIFTDFPDYLTKLKKE